MCRQAQLEVRWGCTGARNTGSDRRIGAALQGGLHAATKNLGLLARPCARSWPTSLHCLSSSFHSCSNTLHCTSSRQAGLCANTVPLTTAVLILLPLEGLRIRGAAVVAAAAVMAAKELLVQRPQHRIGGAECGAKLHRNACMLRHFHPSPPLQVRQPPTCAAHRRRCPRSQGAPQAVPQ